ncbi:unnamed protein product [Leptidea sinapis]|uniref:Phospholipid-transporting ATPase n=1 Tax=Leptidea sinapis TaxID=189913 RepID=A0A5E4QNP0_9NEOP|nr:unnamed protein product [Leptidea sinapis]
MVRPTWESPRREHMAKKMNEESKRITESTMHSSAMPLHIVIVHYGTFSSMGIRFCARTTLRSLLRENNYIKTSKYSIITFLPLNLLEQFQRLANFYFLCLLVLQLIPAISSLTPITTAIPLIGVLALTAVKDAYDDFQRHQNDSQVNHRRAKTLRNGKLVEEKWASVQVGDVIRLENDQFVAADILLLSSSEPNGLCYIETAELDGNAGTRKPHSSISGKVRIMSVAVSIWEISVRISSGKSSCQLASDGMKLKWEQQRPLATKLGEVMETNLKCRQCLPETDAMGQDDAQLGAFDGTLSWREQHFSLDNDKILLRGCVLRNTSWCYGVVVFAGKDTKLMQNSGKTKFKRTSIDRLLNFLIIGIVLFLLSMCVFCTVACGVWEWLVGRYFQAYLPWDTLVPAEPASGATVIAFLVIRFAQSFLINWDEKMYYEKTGTAAKARTTTLNEELDKTGTLTQNIMTFNKCSIAGVCYGDLVDESTGETIELTDRIEPLDFSDNPEYEPEFKFFDCKLLKAVRQGDSNVFDFFRLLALCHTVMPEQKNGRLEYQAQSPDESALVSAARNFGFVFRERSPNTITIEVMGNTEVYELLCILDFNNVRKRMSVILKKDGEIRLYTKGADNVIYERLKRVTAIEDKLQDGVPETIANLSMAGIKIWVLTGDKQETAINIGYSCQLLTDDMAEVFIIDGASHDDVDRQLAKSRDSIRVVNTFLPHGSSDSKNNRETANGGNVPRPSPGRAANVKLNAPAVSVVTFRWEHNSIAHSNEYVSGLGAGTAGGVDSHEHSDDTNGFAIVVNGHSLVHCLHPKLEDNGTYRRGHIGSGGHAGRVSVRLLHRTVPLPPATAAGSRPLVVLPHVQVSAIFLLQELCLHCLPLLTVFDEMFISVYNLFYTSLPVLALGVFEQDVSDVISLQFPKLYAPGHTSQLFNKTEFIKSTLHGCFTSLVLTKMD